MPAVDPNAANLLADKLLQHASGLADVDLRRCWACHRTFAPDRLPIIGWDPEISGLFHVSGLGRFGVTTSLAVDELASALISGRDVGWIDAGSYSPLARRPPCSHRGTQVTGAGRPALGSTPA